MNDSSNNELDLPKDFFVDGGLVSNLPSNTSVNISNLIAYSDLSCTPYSFIDAIEGGLLSSLSFTDILSFEDERSKSQAHQEALPDRKTFVDKQAIKERKKLFFDTMADLVNEEIFEFGTENYADLYVQKNIDNNPLAKEWLNSFFNKNFDDEKVLTSILRIISHIDYDLIKPTGPTMALAVLNHTNPEVQECSIRAFENWGNTESLNMLRNVKCSDKWLQSYLEQVICDLEEIVNAVSR